MKRVLAIVGSPHKGETVLAVRRLEQVMKKLGEAEMEVIMLADIAFKDCLGCHACFMKGSQYCPEAAKVKALQDKMLSADVVLLASPTYNQEVTALMKKFLDYFTFLWHRPELFGVKFFGLATGGGVFGGVFSTMKRNVESWGGTWVGTLGVPHYESLTDKFKKKLDRDFAKKAALIARATGEKRLPRPTFGRLMSFRMWKMNAGVGFSAADVKHWTAKGWLAPGCRYYYEVKINPLTNAAAATAMGLMRRIMRGIYVGY